MRRLATFALWAGAGILFACAAMGQSNYPTQNGQNVPAFAVVVPYGINNSNGQRVYGPPTALAPLTVTCSNCSPSAPTGTPSAPVLATIASTNTFISVLSANPARRGCTLQNKGANTEYWYFGASPTLAAALVVGVGATVSCSTGSSAVLTDQLWVTGTSGDTVVGFSQ